MPIITEKDRVLGLHYVSSKTGLQISTVTKKFRKSSAVLFKYVAKTRDAAQMRRRTRSSFDHICRCSSSFIVGNIAITLVSNNVSESKNTKKKQRIISCDRHT